jgi:RHH-type transcriptional regulator, rel operon repressor / antitoxin RelB
VEQPHSSVAQHSTGMKDMSSTTVSVRIDSASKKRLEKLAKSTGRSRSFLAAEAINEFLDLNVWQVAGIQKAISSLDGGEGGSTRACPRVGQFLGQQEGTTGS